MQPLPRVPSSDLQALLADALAESLILDYHPRPPSGHPHAKLPVEEDTPHDRKELS